MCTNALEDLPTLFILHNQKMIILQITPNGRDVMIRTWGVFLLML